MIQPARRLLSRPWCAIMRRALPVLCLWLAVPAESAEIVTARYDGLTDRYPHAVLGDDLEYETLVLVFSDGKTLKFNLPDTSVFEDTAPRLIDLDGDAAPEVIVVESDAQRGARLAIFDASGRIAATPYIGTRFRWLAPVGGTDLDGDGVAEIAYVDRPHLAKTLRIWRFDSARLTEVAALPGVTNHRIGESDIAGGIRTCGSEPEMILADAAWSRLLAIRFDGTAFELDEIGENTTRDAFSRAMACRD